MRIFPKTALQLYVQYVAKNPAYQRTGMKENLQTHTSATDHSFKIIKDEIKQTFNVGQKVVLINKDFTLRRTYVSQIFPGCEKPN